MAFEQTPEERRQARQAAKEQRKRQQRQLFIKLGIAAAVLVLVAVLIIVLTRPDAPDTTPDTAVPTDTQVQTDPQAGKTVIHLAAAGDLNVTEAVIASGGAEYDYTQTFMDVLPALAQAELATVNLEGSFFGAPYGTDRSAPQGLATALARAGVDLVQLANSYTIYKGIDGLKSTVSAVRAAGMEPVGAYATSEEAAQAKGFTLCQVNGVKIAFVSFTKGMDGMALPAGSENCVNLLYTDYASDYQEVDREGILQVLDACAKAKPDITVALLHWGSEFNNTISKTQNEICTLLHSNGVDAIIGTHSHYVQKMSLDPDSGKFIAYSLGDFCGDADRAGSEYSVILDLEITKDHESGDTRITGYSYTPIFTVREEGKPLRVVRIPQAILGYEQDYIDKVTPETYEAMKYAMTRIEARVTGEEETEPEQ